MNKINKLAIKFKKLSNHSIENQELFNDYWNSFIDDISLMDKFQLMDEASLLNKEMTDALIGGKDASLLEKKFKAVKNQIRRISSEELNKQNETTVVNDYGNLKNIWEQETRDHNLSNDSFANIYNETRLANYEEEIANMTDEEFEQEFKKMEKLFKKINPKDEKALVLFDKFFAILKVYLMLDE